LATWSKSETGCARCTCINTGISSS
jgi:hypothetical protein